MKNRIILLLSLIFTFFTGFTQNTPLTIEGTSGKFYLVHEVAAKENWYSIGRLFNVSPHEIAAFNNLSIDKPLDIAQHLNIPLTATNFEQKQVKLPGETLVPIIHIVEDKEWMYKISSIYNDVPVTSLEKWNSIKRDDVKKGNSLIIGFLKVKTDQSPLASGLSTNPVITSTTAAATKSSKPAEVIPVGMPATQTKPVVSNISTQTAANNAVQVSASGERVNNYAATHTNGGFFSNEYAGAGKSASGLAGTFKSTSGWSDGKYYALMNNVPVGTIIRVTGSNGKSIYAKVLGQLPEMKESAGLVIRISNASAAELGLGEGKFPVEIKY